MIDVYNHKWKYLRESRLSSDFNYRRNTTLEEYLGAIYPGHEFVYDKPIPKDIVLSRCKGVDIRRFRPDARCEELSLIVEFDGLPHYQDTKVILADRVKDEYLCRLGYKVVRIPYWIQLTNEVIECLFGVNVNEPMCELTYSFSDTSKDDFGLSICPGNMCEAGRETMMDQFKLFPKSTQRAILEDLQRCIDNRPNECPASWIVPNQMMDDLMRIMVLNR